MRKLPVQKRPARKLLGAVIAAALFLPNAGFTLGLGEIDVNSALNQRLNADIELLSATPEDTETLIVKLASRKEFSRAGIDRPYLLNDLRFKSEIINGVPHIKVSSGSPIREPFLNFLVEIDWPNGHLLREYTVLLDPPVFMTKSASPAPAQSGGAPASAGFRPSAGGSLNVVPVPVASAGVTASPRPAATAQAPAAQQSAQPTWIPAPVIQQQNSLNQPAGSYKIKSGDTAWSLADAMRPDQSITVPQMMIAMLRANPESFIDENVNGLKRGYILRVPDYDQITSISNADAMALVKEQAALWRQYQQSQSGGQPVSAMESDAKGGSMNAAADGDAAADDAYLEIVSAGSGSSTSSGKDPTQMSAQELRAELALARERVETELVEKEALQQRVETLQQHVDKMKGMLSIEDTELAAVQSLADSMPAAADEAAMSDDMAADAEAMKDEMTGEVEAMSVEGEAMAEDAAVDMSDEAAIADAMMDEAIEEEAVEGEEALFVDEAGDSMPQQADAESVEVKPMAKPEARIEPEQAGEEASDPLTQLLNNPMMLAAAGGGLLLIVALIGLIIKRRKSADEETVAPVMADGFDDLESLADDIAGGVDDTTEQVSLAGDSEAAENFDAESTMILDSVEDTIVAESDADIDSGDEPRDDVIAEADVYLAYGIYQQAEELLTQAIADSPDRDDYRVKLAETHYASKNADAFVTVANELQPRVDADSASWKKVVGMGQDLCADNPMFQGSMVGMTDVAPVSAETPEMDFDLGIDNNEGEASADLDLSLDEDPLELSADEADDDSDETLVVDELEFDLSDAGAVDETTDADNEFSLDIDASELDIDIVDEAADAAEEVKDEVEESLDLSDIDIGLDEVIDDKEDVTDVVEDAAAVDLDFGLDDSASEIDVTAALDDGEEIILDLTEEAAELDMDLGDAEETMVETAEGTAVEIMDAPAEAVSAVEEPVADEPEEAPAVPVVSMDMDDEEDFDLSSLDDVDEVSTKLDLARAYLDMGDHEGARGILEEVLADGDDEQKKEASELMAKLD